MSKIQIIALIIAFLTLTIGSFVWFIATWDASKEQPIGLSTPPQLQFVIILPKVLPPEAPAFQERATL